MINTAPLPRAPKPAGRGAPAVADDARRRLLLLLDRSLDFIEIIGEDGVIKGASAAITARGGYEPEELVGRHYKQILHPDDWNNAIAAVRAIVVLTRDITEQLDADAHLADANRELLGLRLGMHPPPARPRTGRAWKEHSR